MTTSNENHVYSDAMTSSFDLDMEKEERVVIKATQELRQMLFYYRKQYPQLTLNHLATKSGIAFSTLRRMTMEGSQKCELSPHIVLHLSSYLMREKRITRLIEMLPPNISIYLKQHFGQYCFEFDQENEVLKSHVVLRLIDQCFYSYVFTRLAQTAEGIHGARLLLLIGNTEAVRTIKKFINEQLVYKDDREHYHLKDKKVEIPWDIDCRYFQQWKELIEDNLQQTSKLSVALSNINEDTRGTESDQSYFALEGLNSDAVKQVEQLINDFYRSVNLIYENPAARGDQFMALMANKLKVF